MGEWLMIGEAGVNLPANAVTFRHPLGLGVLSEIPLTATVDEEMLEVIRIEAAVPKWGVDMDETRFRMRRAWKRGPSITKRVAISDRRPIARIKTYGHVNRRLVQIVLDHRQRRLCHQHHRTGTRFLRVIATWGR